MSVFTDKSIKNKRFVWDFKKCQIVTDKTSSWKTHPPTNVEMMFLVATLVWMPPFTKNSRTATKTYWSILKTFLKGTKIPIISPLFVENELVTDFLEKANLLNNFF